MISPFYAPFQAVMASRVHLKSRSSLAVQSLEYLLAELHGFAKVLLILDEHSVQVERVVGIEVSAEQHVAHMNRVGQ
jgi:hypothetical protein